MIFIETLLAVGIIVILGIVAFLSFKLGKHSKK